MRKFWTVIDPTKKIQTFSLPSDKYSHHLDLLHYWQVFTSPGDFASKFIQCLYQRVNPNCMLFRFAACRNHHHLQSAWKFELRVLEKTPRKKFWAVPEPRKKNTEISVAPFIASKRERERERSGLFFFETFLVWIHVGSCAKLINMHTWSK